MKCETRLISWMTKHGVVSVRRSHPVRALFLLLQWVRVFRVTMETEREARQI